MKPVTRLASPRQPKIRSWPTKRPTQFVFFSPSGSPALRKRTNPRPRLRPPAPDFDGAGGFLDIYGLMFGIGNGVFVDLFDDGVSPTTGMNYGGFGVGVATANESWSTLRAASWRRSPNHRPGR